MGTPALVAAHHVLTHVRVTQVFVLTLIHIYKIKITKSYNQEKSEAFP